MIQLVRSPHASSLYSTHALLVRTTCAVDDVADAISARHELLLDPYAPGAHYLCDRWCSWCNLYTPRLFARPVCSWQALPVPLILQLALSPNVSSPRSIRVQLTDTNCGTGFVAQAVMIRLTMFRVQQSSPSTISGGGDTTIPSPRRSPKQPLPGIGLHGRQACF